MSERARKDLELTVTVRNNQIKSRRQVMGLSQKDLAAAAGISFAVLCGFESLRESPTKVLRDFRCRAPGCLKNFSLKHSKSFCAHHAPCSEADKNQWLAGYARPELIAWRSSASALATFFGTSPGVLFPDAIKAVKKSKIVSTIDVPELMAALGLASGEQGFAEIPSRLEDAERDAAVSTALRTLTQRERDLLRSRFVDEEPLSVIADRMGVGAARAGQIEARALRRLRKPSVARRLREVL